MDTGKIRCGGKRLLALVFLAAVFALTACAPQDITGEEIDQGSTQEEDITAAIEWSGDSDCAMCHLTEQETYEVSACLVSMHTEVRCTDCHNDFSTMKTVHKGKTITDKMPKKLKQTEMSDKTCLSCHYETKEVLLDATPTAAVVDSKGLSVNPHGLPPSENHDAILCSDCHGMHVEEPIQERAETTCLNCHHANVYECHTCHE